MTLIKAISKVKYKSVTQVIAEQIGNLILIRECSFSEIKNTRGLIVKKYEKMMM